MKLTRLLTNKLTSFWLLSLAAVAFIFLLVALVSFTQLTYKFQQQKVTELESMLIHHYEHESNKSLSTWLPSILTAYNTVSLTLSAEGKTLYQYGAGKSGAGMITYERLLIKPDKLTFVITLPQPFKMYSLSWYEFSILVIGLLSISVFVFLGHRWLSMQLQGIEDLAVRSKLILENEYDKALAERGDGRPRMINRALTHLLLELDDAEKQRARFDQFIRSNTFLDPETGIGNR